MATFYADRVEDYEEPWRVDGRSVVGETGAVIIGETVQLHTMFPRIVACVNACKGMVDPVAEIRKLKEAVQEEKLAREEKAEFQVPSFEDAGGGFALSPEPEPPKSPPRGTNPRMLKDYRNRD